MARTSGYSDRQVVGSTPFHYHVTTLDKLFTHTRSLASVTKQYNLVLAKRRRCSASGR